LRVKVQIPVGARAKLVLACAVIFVILALEGVFFPASGADAEILVCWWVDRQL